ncbi:MAG: CDP-alcohol phosphatidyltransferase family protein [Elusimicrobiales bacterium]|nr:CDP-alcohol phosphatidyltransferase family protein [Elusimicrobiales bacterium]
MTLANKITLTRTVLGIFLFFLIDKSSLTFLILAFCVLIISTISDYFDGKIARETNTITKFGAIIDPYADKIIVFSCYLAFADIPELNIPLFAIFLIIIRELSIASLRVLAALDNYVLSAEKSGKFKTLTQFITIYLIMIYLIISTAPIENNTIKNIIEKFKNLPSYLVIFASLVTVISGILYISNHYKMIEKQWKK